MSSKKYTEALAKVDRTQFYEITTAVTLAKEIANKKFDETVEVGMKLGIDPKQADQTVRGTVALPNGTGKTARVIVFAVAEKADQAKQAGADEVGGDELVAKVAGGWTDFDVAVATPDMMGKVGTLGRVLGPRGLMPNPKTGTVTMDTAQAVTDIKGGKIEFRADRHGNLHLVIGKVSFTPEQLVENYQVAIEEIRRHKPAAVKGRFIEKAVLSTTMGPGIPLQLND
ncbi:MAG: 50S ribosomal protein L1 [Bifidobacteriaceae bacterium]|jgi:large subunit ribosomal protein L1|nr:50S ribosomal protein L1 [Bifidobacteriaceae bacterium]